MRVDSARRSWRPALLAAAGSLALLAPAGRPAVAEGAAALAVPQADGLVLDGAPSEAAWAKALEMTASPTPTPLASGGQAAPPPPAAPAGKPPRVRLLLSGPRLWVAVDAAEDVGFPIGVQLMIATDATKSAAEAVAIAYKPQEVRGPRWVARGPRGAGRAAYRVAGALDVTRDDAWSLEVAVPLADLAPPSPEAPLRVGIVVSMRTPNVIFEAPAGSAFHEPSSFAVLVPPPGGWPAGADGVPAADGLLAEDAADAKRFERWQALRKANVRPYPSLEAKKAALIPILDEAIAARPDLAAQHLVKASILSQFEDRDGAAKEFEAALTVVPHLPEAEWGRDYALVDRLTTRPPTEPSDFDAAFARVAKEAERVGAGSVVVRAAEGILRCRHGDFARAAELLKPIAAEHPEGDLVGLAQVAAQYPPLWQMEQSFRKDDEAKNLPRVKVTTSRGSFTVELFEDDAPNTVANFVWLARARFYDGTTFHRTIPFFMVQTGDPFSKTKDPHVGTGGPGWAIPSETAHPKRPRRHFRGVLSMANSGKDTEGSQFFVTTGTAGHLDGVHTVFGRVLDGMDVVDHVVLGDVLLTMEVVRARDHEYRPTTVGGVPAPAPPKGPPDAPPSPPATPPGPSAPPAAK